MQEQVLDPLWQRLEELGAGHAKLIAVPGNHDLVRPDPQKTWGQCGLARPRVPAGGRPAWVIVSREPSIEPCSVDSNGHVDA